MLDYTHCTWGQTSPWLGQGWQQQLCHSRKGKAVGFPSLPDVAPKTRTLHSAYSLQGRFFRRRKSGLAKTNSRLLRAGISPWSLAPRYLFSLNRCHQRCWALWWAARGASPSNAAARCPSDTHAVPCRALSCGCRYSGAGWGSLEDLLLLPAASTGFVHWDKDQAPPSLWLFWLLQIYIHHRREMKRLTSCPSKIQSCHKIWVSGKPNWKKFCSLRGIQAELKYPCLILSISQTTHLTLNTFIYEGHIRNKKKATDVQCCLIWLLA